jgi:phage gpG-like protein
LNAEVDADLLQLQEIINRLEQPADLNRLMGNLLVDFEREVFATRGRGAWQADDEVTIAAKGGAQVLVDSGNLLRELTDPHIDGESVFVDQGDATYAIFQQRGARGMPERDPAPEPSDSVVDGWTDQLLGFILEGRR